MITEAELARTRIKLEAIAQKLELKPTSIREEIVLARFIEGKLLKAAKLFLKSVRFDRPKRSSSYLNCLKCVWETTLVGDGFMEFEVDDPLIKEIYPEICKTIIVDSQCSGKVRGWVERSLSGSYTEMNLCVNDIEASVTKKEFKKNLEKLIFVVYHECDHLTFAAKVVFESGIESHIQYMLDHAEVRAHSKQIAYLYFKYFPAKRFNYENLKRYIMQRYTLNDREFQIIQILEFFKNPRNPPFTKKESIEFAYAIAEGKNEEFTRKILLKAFKQYLLYIAYFVNYFNQMKVVGNIRLEMKAPGSLKGPL